MWQILPAGTTAGMSVAQNAALTVVLLLAVIGFFTVIGFVQMRGRRVS